jgi:glycosyltransferase involved in cell wall biosynthesis
MKKIIYLPFEELPQRYTEMWNYSFIKKMSPDDIIVNGNSSSSNTIENGEFLDTFNTIKFKQSQIIEVANLFQQKRINDGDAFFIPDIFYPGIESIKYMAELSDIKIHIIAFNHAGRADEDDFVQKLKQWSDVQEQAWHDMADIVLVGSQYHAYRVRKKFNHKDIRVVGAIWNSEWMAHRTSHLSEEKKDYVIWPHRISKEKGFDLLLQVANANKDLQFLITSCGKNRLNGISLPSNVTYKPNLTKEQYLSLFKGAKYYLSTAHQETFGYTVQEAIFFKCKIIVPRYACYQEYVDDSCLVDYADMTKENFITEKFLNCNIDKNNQFHNNAELIYQICTTSENA